MAGKNILPIYPAGGARVKTPPSCQAEIKAMYKILFIILSTGGAALIMNLTPGYGEREFMRLISGRWIEPKSCKFMIWQVAFLTAGFGVAVPTVFLLSAFLMRLYSAASDF